MLLVCAASLSLAGCKKYFAPTYPSAKMAEGLVGLCQKEYKRSVVARRVGQSLQVMYALPGTLGATEALGLDKKALDALDDVFQAASRVVLSTDRRPEFVEVIFKNPQTQRAIVMWRYVPDLLRFSNFEYPSMESLERLVFVTDMELDEFDPKAGVDWPKPASQGDFLARQIVQRVKKSADALELKEDTSEPGMLRITVENWPEGPAPKKSEVVDLCKKQSRDVLQAYRFKGFKTFVLQDMHGAALGRWNL
jgi:hypothetical protein